ncbi:THUMP domain-containing protein 2 isoform X1 [Cheilinus undulatus]|uniref:THUMP domain-containing protein 2 isoform X1 n=1 Tax=Cheilinus undulatus TaxID=241271 RepID=UPI001BD41478|nr:THUMP domain-containing protein 2 isoform X1 [Cheilinus undulatus]
MAEQGSEEDSVRYFCTAGNGMERFVIEEVKKKLAAENVCQVHGKVMFTSSAGMDKLIELKTAERLFLLLKQDSPVQLPAHTSPAKAASVLQSKLLGERNQWTGALMTWNRLQGELVDSRRTVKMASSALGVTKKRGERRSDEQKQEEKYHVELPKSTGEPRETENETLKSVEQNEGQTLEKWRRRENEQKGVEEAKDKARKEEEDQSGETFFEAKTLERKRRRDADDEEEERRGVTQNCSRDKLVENEITFKRRIMTEGEEENGVFMYSSSCIKDCKHRTLSREDMTSIDQETQGPLSDGISGSRTMEDVTKDLTVKNGDYITRDFFCVFLIVIIISTSASKDFFLPASIASLYPSPLLCLLPFNKEKTSDGRDKTLLPHQPPSVPVSFRISCKCTGSLSRYFNTQEVSRMIGVGLSRLMGWKADLKNPQLEINVYLSDSHCLLGIPLTRLPLANRCYIRTTGLRSTVAWAMASLAQIQPGFCVVDLMCGVGTILIEAAKEHKAAFFLGMDNDDGQLLKANENIEVAELGSRIHLLKASSLALPLPGTSVDAVVCDLPFGRKFGTKANMAANLPLILTEMERILRIGGSMVLLLSPQLSCLLKKILVQAGSGLTPNQETKPSTRIQDCPSHDPSSTEQQTLQIHQGVSSPSIQDTDPQSGLQHSLPSHLTSLKHQATFRVSLGVIDGLIHKYIKIET